MTAIVESERPRAAALPAHLGIRFHRVRVRDLSVTASLSLFESMRQVAAAAVRSDLGDSSWLEERWPARWLEFRGLTTFTAYAGNQLVGFMWVTHRTVSPLNFVQLQAAYILPEFQGQGVGFALNARMFFREIAFQPRRSTFIIADVVSPIALHGWRSRARLSGSFYPVIHDDGPVPTVLRSAACQAAREFYGDARFNPSTGVLHERTAPRPQSYRWSGDGQVDRYFRDLVSAQDGDACLVVMRPRPVEVICNTDRVLGAVRRLARKPAAGDIPPQVARKEVSGE